MSDLNNLPAGYLDFFEGAKKFGKKLSMKLKEGEPTLVISHIDADGISSASLIASFLMDMNTPFQIKFVKYLTPEIATFLEDTGYKTVILTDIGSGYLDFFEKTKREIYIMDHHPLKGKLNEHTVLINPHIYGIDGSKEVSAAGVVYFVINAVKDHRRYSFLPLIGAVGDRQGDNKFTGLNKVILDEALDSGVIKVKHDLKLFGGAKYPLVFSLEKTINPYIPGISNDEAGCVSFLDQLGIPLMKGGVWTRLADLSLEEKRLIASELVKRMVTINTPEDKLKEIIGEIYEIVGEEETSPIKDIKDFSVILNACGRMENAGLGVALGLGYRGKILEKVKKLYRRYRQEISTSVRKALNTNKIHCFKRLIILNLTGLVRDTILGPVISIFSSLDASKDYDVIIGVSASDNDKLKILMPVYMQLNAILSNQMMDGSEDCYQRSALQR